jgi:hypothetical protein
MVSEMGKIRSVANAGIVALGVASLFACGAGCGGNGGGAAAGTGGTGGGTAQFPGTGGTGGGGGTGGAPLPFPAPSASLAPGSVCDSDGWCWYNPLPSGTGWMGVSGTGPTDLWVGGFSRMLLHLEGATWKNVTSPLQMTNSIWSASAGDVWFVGTTGNGTDGAVAHWDGSKLSSATVLDAAELADVWGTGPNDVYAVGPHTAQHWDGHAWTAVPGITGQTVSASAPNDVWVGASNGLQHFDGTSWSRVPALEQMFVVGVSALAPDDVWAAVLHGGAEDVEHFDGRTWTVSLHVADPVQNGISSIAAASSSDVWVVGGKPERPQGGARGHFAHFDGGSWTEGAEAPTALGRVRVVPGVGSVAVGANGGMALLTGGTPPGFTDLASGPAQNLSGVWGSAPNDMWAAGEAGTIIHFNGQTVGTAPSGVSTDLTDLGGTAANDVWAVGGSGTALRFDGTAFHPVATGSSTDLTAVFTARRNDVWAGGGSTLLHFDGQSFQAVALPGADASTRIFDMSGTSATDVWLCGHTAGAAGGGFVSHFDGTAWAPLLVLNATAGSYPATRIWSLAPNDVWVLTTFGFRGRISFYHFDGTSWTERFIEPSPETYMFPKPVEARGSFSFGPHDVWLVGTLGTWQRNTQQ